MKTDPNGTHLGASMEHRSPLRNRLYRRTAMADRFWAKVRRTDGCWAWTAATDKHGYGIIHGPGKIGRLYKAHRISWELHNGPIPRGLFVLHRCDNPNCVRPDHLFLGTAADNSQDAARKGRLVFQKHPELCPRGADAGAAKLKQAEVDEIRSLHRAGHTQTSIAKRFRVTQQTVSYIVRFHTWRDAPRDRRLSAKELVSGGGEVKASDNLF